MNRSIKPKLRLFVEGKSEKNYFEDFGKKENVEFVIESIDMRGGGYSNFLQRIKEKGYQGCTAVIIIIDLDKIDEDKANFEKLVRYCKTQNKNKGCPIPYILIGSYEDFEYFACCHSQDYKGRNTSDFILKNYKYKSVDDFKADSKIYDFLNNSKSNRSFKNACDMISKKDTYLKNIIEPKGKNGDITIKLCSFQINEQVRNIKNSNINELFKLIEDTKKLY